MPDNLVALTKGLTASWGVKAGKAKTPVLTLSGMAMSGASGGQVVNMVFEGQALLNLQEAVAKALAQDEQPQEPR